MMHGDRMNALEIEIHNHEASQQNREDLIKELQATFLEKDQMIQKHKSIIY